ncbi:MAG: hypothetical protein ACETWG_06570 [Candidatus Neomarinimicrobiota bacterium]
MMIPKRFLIILIAPLVFVACAIAPQVMQMVPDVSGGAFHHSNKRLILGTVTGGEESDPFIKGSRIDALSFRGALLVALGEARLFQMVRDYTAADYTLNAMIVSQDQPIIGVDMTVSLIVRYYLVDSSNNQLVWSKDIISTYQAAFLESLVASERVRKANEGAVRTNLGYLLAELSSLQL